MFRLQTPTLRLAFWCPPKIQGCFAAEVVLWHVEGWLRSRRGGRTESETGTLCTAQPSRQTKHNLYPVARVPVFNLVGGSRFCQQTHLHGSRDATTCQHRGTPHKPNHISQSWHKHFTVWNPCTLMAATVVHRRGGRTGPSAKMVRASKPRVFFLFFLAI